MSEPVPHSGVPRSLLVRTTSVLALALIVFFGALVLVLRPYLAAAFESRSAQMLGQDQVRDREALRERNASLAGVLQAVAAHARERTAAAALDAPIELVTGDAAVVRPVIETSLARAAEGSAASLAALAAQAGAENDSRSEADASAELARGARMAKEFGDELGWRAASLLLGIAAVLFLVHGTLLWRSVIAPVARLSEAAREVAKGRLAVRLEVDGNDEVARLAANFNTMTQSLERAQGELVALNATLEQRVREKSAALVQAERELHHAEKMASLGTLAGGVAHEFNNLLGGIQGCAEDAARETDPEEIRETLGVIERTARRGTAITEKLLGFARPAAAGREDVDVAGVARDVATLVLPEAARSGVEVRVEAPAEARLRADPTGMHQVMLNLATNAVHAMPRGGKLTIGVTRDERELRVTVADTGAGIAPQDRARLFEPFFTTRAEGTGLGLSVSYAIVKAHGGRIDVDSAPGRGARFTVSLPIDAPERGSA